MQNVFLLYYPQELVGVKGWLKIFCIVQLYVAPAMVSLTLITTILGDSSVGEDFFMHPLGNLFVFLLAIVLTIYGISIGCSLMAMDRGTVFTVKGFLVISLLLYIVVSIFPSQSVRYLSSEEAVTQFVIGVGWYSLIILAWYLCFDRSKRIAATYGILPK